MALNRDAKWMYYLFIIGVTLILYSTYSVTYAAGPLNKSQLIKLRNQTKARQALLIPKPVSSFNQLKSLLASKSVQGYSGRVSELSLAQSADLAATSASSSGQLSYSATNVQVDGVDEADIVKTDGQIIYKIDHQKVRIIQAYPAASMSESAALEFADGFSPSQLFLHDNLLIVLGSTWSANNNNDQSLATGLWWGGFGESHTLARIYHVADHTHPVLQREISLAGDYVSSRLIGHNFYLISRKYPNYLSGYYSGNNVITRDNTLPHIKDSVINSGNEFNLPLSNLYYFPNFIDPSYTIVAGLRLDALHEKADIKAYLGSGETVYASHKNLYISAADYNYSTNGFSSQPKTHFYKFGLNNGKVSFLKAGEVPGVVLNAFSMDEHQDYFRVATTVNFWTETGGVWKTNTWNNLYTLDSDMKIAGRIEHLANDERIYSARFMEDRCYLVTFRQTDPFFVIDLSVPNTPKLLGELKIPGFSFYLHPYDEHHLIGFGQDTEENAWGGVTAKGMKLSLFDVTDVAHPAQLHSLTIGGQGTYSPLQWDHKALLFDKQHNLFGFPIYEANLNQQGEFEWFQGAQIYSISVDEGFKALAAITHQTQQNGYDNWHHEIQRLLTINDQLYTISTARLQANDLTNFRISGFLDFSVAESQGCFFYPLMATANFAVMDACLADSVVTDELLVKPVVSEVQTETANEALIHHR